MNVKDEGKIVIMGDLQGSRKLDSEERYKAQLFLKLTLAQINENYSEYVEAPFMITKGDEFQGVLTNISVAFDILLDLERLLYPLYFRFGMGMGLIHKMGGTLPIEMDGPAFHLANKALKKAKQIKQNIIIYSGNEFVDQLVNQILILVYSIKKQWKEDYFQYYWQYKELKSIKKIAEYRNISAQAVSSAIQRLHIKEIYSAEETTKNLLCNHKDKEQQ
ncbi:MAG: SatD family protein [Calditrichia bacterium]